MTGRVKAVIDQAESPTAERAELLEELTGETTEDIAKALADEPVRRVDGVGPQKEPWPVGPSS